MNRYAFYVQEIFPGQWRAMVRFSKDGQPKPIMAKGNKPEIYGSEPEAYRALNKAVATYFNGEYLRCGETISKREANMRKAERIFMGGGKVVPIEHKERVKA
jgi:hypothetical protein